jgi:hypothetical protein
MKIKFILAGVLLVGLTFSGCQKIKSLLDVHFDTQFSVDMNVNVPAASSLTKVNSTFNESATIDPNDDADVAKYGNLIKSFDISSASAVFSNVSKNVTLVSADLTITSGSQTATWHYENVQITNGTTFALDNDSGQWATVNAILGSLNPFTVSISGETDVDDVTYVVTVNVAATVTANPLGAK